MDSEKATLITQKDVSIRVIDVAISNDAIINVLEVQLNNMSMLSGYPKAKLIAHLEKSLNAFIAKTKKEEVL